MKKMLVLAGFVLATTSSIFGQSYKTAAGLRLGGAVGFTVNQYLFEGNTLEAIIQPAWADDQQTGISVLFEHHKKVLFRGTNFYLGGGGHHYFAKNDLAAKSGLSGILGAEISLGKLNVAVDWKPEFHFADGGGKQFESAAAVSVRYIFVKRERTKLKDRLKFRKKKSSKPKSKKGLFNRD